MNKRVAFTNRLLQAKGSVLSAGKAAMAGAAGAALLVGNAVRSARESAAGVVKTIERHKKAEEGIVMRKSTFIAIIAALAAVAGVLAALYFYVLRREKELDEYEQLLFSEDFNDELPEDAELAVE